MKQQEITKRTGHQDDFLNQFPANLEHSNTIVAKLTTTSLTLSQHSNKHVVMYVSSLPTSNKNMLEGMNEIANFYGLISNPNNAKIIFLALQATRVYQGLAHKALHMVQVQYSRSITQLQKAGILEEVTISSTTEDPFLRWVKGHNPNADLKRILMFKITQPYSHLLAQLEDELAGLIGKEMADTIRHYRFQIRRTHADIEHEIKIKRTHKQREVEMAKKDKYCRFIGICASCNVELFHREPSRMMPEVQQNYRIKEEKPYCIECVKQ